MALQMNLELNNGLKISNAYIRISYVYGDKTKVSIRVDIYASQKCFLDKKKPLQHSKNYYFTPSLDATATNFLEQGYQYMKTLDEFKDAKDV